MEGLYCVQSGCVKLSRGAEDGQRFALRIARPGDVLGLGSLLSDGHSHADAEMLEEGHLCFTPRNVVLDLIRTNPELTRGVMELLAARIVESEGERFALARRSVGELLARLLLLLGQSHGFADGDRIVIDFTLSVEDLAEMLGSTRETTSRCMSWLKREGLVVREGKQLILQDPARLEKLAVGEGR